MVKIAVDLDSTLNTLIDSWLAWYNSTYDDSIVPSDITDWHIHNFIPEGEVIYDYFDVDGAFRDLDIQPLAYDTMQWLCERADVYIVSAYAKRPRQCVEKFEWVERELDFFPTNRIVFTSDKSIIATDYLIDDGPPNLLNFLGQSIVYDQPWNRGAELYHLPRMLSWMDIRSFFENTVYYE